MNGHLAYFIAGLLDGAALTYYITGLQMKRAALRRAQQVADEIKALGK